MRSQKKKRLSLQPAILIPIIAVAVIVLLALINAFSFWNTSKNKLSHSRDYYGKPGGPTPPAKQLSANLGGAQGSLGSKGSLITKPFGETTKGFYAKVTSIQGKQLTLTELIPHINKDAVENGKTYTVRSVQETLYVHQKQNTNNKKDAPLFSPVEGDFKDIQPGLYVYVSSYEDPKEKTNLTALEIIYSEQNPFVRQ